MAKPMRAVLSGLRGHASGPSKKASQQTGLLRRLRTCRAPLTLFRRDGARAVEDVALGVHDVRRQYMLTARQRLEQEKDVIGDGRLQ